MAERRNSKAVKPDETEGVWSVEAGAPSKAGKRPKTYGRNQTEQLTYDNPYGQEIERVWFDGKIVFAIEAGEVDVDVKKVKVAQEYQVVYSVELNRRGKKSAMVRLDRTNAPTRSTAEASMYLGLANTERPTMITHGQTTSRPATSSPATLQIARWSATRPDPCSSASVLMFPARQDQTAANCTREQRVLARARLAQRVHHPRALGTPPS